MVRKEIRIKKAWKSKVQSKKDSSILGNVIGLLTERKTLY